MKKSIILAILLAASFAYAGTSNVSFRWDANSEPDLAGYRLYRSPASGGPYTMITEIPCAPNDTTCTEYTELDVPDGTYYWVATAYDTEGFESAYSNEQTRRLDTTAPTPPQNLSIWEIIISWIKNLFGRGLRIG